MRLLRPHLFPFFFNQRTIETERERERERERGECQIETPFPRCCPPFPSCLSLSVCLCPLSEPSSGVVTRSKGVDATATLSLTPASDSGQRLRECGAPRSQRCLRHRVSAALCEPLNWGFCSFFLSFWRRVGWSVAPTPTPSMDGVLWVLYAS